MIFKDGQDRLQAAGITTYVTQGQHERADPPWATIHPNVVHIGDGKTREMVCDGQKIKVRGYDHMSAGELQAQLEKDAKRCNYEVLILHQILKGAMNFEGAWDLCAEWVPEKVRLVLLGDYHTAGTYNRIFHYPGATHLRAIDEAPVKSFMLVKYQDGDFVVERAPLNTRKLLSFTIVDDESLENAIDVIKKVDHDADDEAIREPIVYARVASTIEGAVDTLKELCSRKNGFVLIPRSISEGTELVEDVEVPSGPVSLEACLASVVDPEQEPEFYNFVLKLLQAQDPAATLREWRANMGV
jgi:DNA repair exonuclease SbcCD nuclease subunit